MWIFGYGSLIWKVDFPYEDCVECFVEHFALRFHQGSPDHRGTPEAPGRVATLEHMRDAKTYGIAYFVSPDLLEQVIEQLDEREKGGYIQQKVKVTVRDTGETLDAITYLGPPGNEDYLGPASAHDIATQIFTSSGPSGPNSEYLLKVAKALRSMSVEEPHTFAIERELRAMLDAAHDG